MWKKTILLVMGVLIVGMLGFLAGETWNEVKNNPRLVLIRGAQEYNYPHYLYSISVPPSTLPTKKLQEWREFSEKNGLDADAHFFHPAMEGKVHSLRVNFNKTGTEIIGVSIEWWRDEKSWGFPYRLDEKETVALVHKAIGLMAERSKKS